MRALSESFAVCRKSEAYPCREKWREILRRFAAFGCQTLFSRQTFMTIRQTFMTIERFWEMTDGMVAQA
jgi:hypothetical protein